MDKQTVRNDFKDTLPGVILGAVARPLRWLASWWENADRDSRAIAACMFTAWLAIAYFEHEKAGRREWADALHAQRYATEAAINQATMGTPFAAQPISTPSFNSAAELIKLIEGGVAPADAQATVRAMKAGRGGPASFSFTVPELGAPRALGLAPSIDPGVIGQAPAHPCAQKWWPEIVAAGRKHDVDPNLIVEFMGNESACDPAALSSAKAMGLLQLMPATAQGIAPACGEDASRVWDPAVNVSLGACYIRQMADMLTGGRLTTYDDIFRVAWAYNAGPGRVQQNFLPAETGPYARAIASAYTNRR